MNSQLTDELIETLKGIKEGKEWEVLFEGRWECPSLAVWSYLDREWSIRLKPFVPEPPEGYRLLEKEKCERQFIPGAWFWSNIRDAWQQLHSEEGFGCVATPTEHIAVPLTPPAPEYVPWTFETFPKDRLVWLKPKEGYHRNCLSSVGVVKPAGLDVTGHSYVPWETLLNHWIQETGEPCGTIKQ